MKFFEALIAKLTGGDTAPKTLDQARATFGEAKSALDKVGAMFAAASLDFDALLAQGDTALKDFIAGLNAKVTAAEAASLEAKNAFVTSEAKVVAAEAKSAEALAKVETLNSLLGSVGFKPAEVKGKEGAAATAEEQAAALQHAFKSHISGAVTQQLQELGQPSAKLPGSSPSTNATSADNEADLLAQLAETTDPVAKGKIGAALNALRDKAWGKN